MTQYLVTSLHRAVRGRCYALTDCKPGRRETLDTDIKTFEVPSGISRREAIAFVTVNGWVQRDDPPEGAPWITSL